MGADAGSVAPQASEIQSTINRPQSESAWRKIVRRTRRALHAEPRGEGRPALSLLCLAQPDNGYDQTIPPRMALAAPEIERIVAVAARQILDDQKAILDAVQGAKIASNQIPDADMAKFKKAIQALISANQKKPKPKQRSAK
jgi:hypothetical protein